MDKFSQMTKEKLGFYVYILIDPRDGKVFYVGKGKDDRVFAHIKCSLSETQDSEKLDIIRSITSEGFSVRHYIVRHNLTEREALTVESVFLDFLTYHDFEFVAKIAAVQAGYRQWSEGIKTVEELEILYNCAELSPADIHHRILSININRTYNLKNDLHPNIYEATRKSWKLNAHRLKTIDYVFSEYKGIVRAIFQPSRWERTSDNRWYFEGIEVTDEAIVARYLHKKMPPRKIGNRMPSRYFNPLKP